VGRCPTPRPKGFALWNPTRGAAPGPRKGHWPLTHHPEIPKDFRGIFWRSLIKLACLCRSNQGAFRSPPGPLRSASLQVDFAETMKTVPPTNRLISLHPEGTRRIPKGDRKALWSPVRAKTHLADRILPLAKVVLRHKEKPPPGGDSAVRRWGSLRTLRV